MILYDMQRFNMLGLKTSNTWHKKNWLQPASTVVWRPLANELERF